MMRRAVLLFTRIPLPGRTKTRMMPSLTPKQCARLHAELIRDAARAAADCGPDTDLFVFYDGPDTELWRLAALIDPIVCAQKKGSSCAQSRQVLRRSDFLKKEKTAVYLPQRGDGLGARMYAAMQTVLGADWSYDAAVLAGTDIPALCGKQLRQAFRLLQSRDVVLGGTEDGGYYLVGMKRAEPAVFALDTYGTGSVLSQTAEQAWRAGCSLGFTERLMDLDTPEDLSIFQKMLRKDRRLQKTYTGRYLTRTRKISIIVPLYNEAKTIEKLQAQLRPLRKDCEILLVDGGSTDGTCEKIDPAFHLIHTEKGRARQMNAGAKRSTGEILFFLHADSELPPHPLAWIRRVMETHEAGCFGIAFHSRNFFMWTCRVISNHRVKDRKVMFGDQGIFIDRNLFFAAGMFPELPLMEDYQLSLKLKKMGIKLGMAGRRIYTSDRRFPKGTIPKLRLMWKMNRLRKKYRDGVPAEELAAEYRDAR